MTSEGVGELDDGNSTDGTGRSWLELDDEPDPVLAAFTAPARVVTISSPRESFENCSTDMKKVKIRMMLDSGCRIANYISAQHRRFRATILADASRVEDGPPLSKGA